MRRVFVYFCFLFFGMSSHLCFAKFDINAEIKFERDLAFLKSKKFICISLGNDCRPAMCLREHGLRYKAFPFDWCITPFDALYSALESKMVDMSNPKYMRGSPQNNVLVNVRYNLVHMHSMKTNEGLVFTYDGIDLGRSTQAGQDAFKWFYDSSQRRVRRFYAALELGLPVYFFRFNEITEKEAVKLRDFIQKSFPKLDFTLVCFFELEDRNKWKKHDKIFRFTLDVSKHSIYGRPKGSERHPSFTRLLRLLGLEFPPEKKVVVTKTRSFQ